jgi:hypothetical protein
MSSLVLGDLVFLKSAGISVDQEFAQVFAYENKHRDFSACHGCGAKTYEQHSLECPSATVLTRVDWVDVVQGRQRERKEQR